MVSQMKATLQHAAGRNISRNKLYINFINISPKLPDNFGIKSGTVVLIFDIGGLEKL